MQIDASTYLRSYLPRWLIGAPAPEREPLKPRATGTRAAAAFVDISGFSQLTQFYGVRDDGLEQLSLIVSDCFDSLIDLVFTWGGDVENVHGDGLLCFWLANEAGADESIRHALGCAAEMVERYDHYPADADIEIRIRAAVVFGELFALQVGGVAGDWAFLLAGDCLLEIGPMLATAKPGQITVSPALRARLPRLGDHAAPWAIRRLGGERPGNAIVYVAPAQPTDEMFLRAFVPAAVRDAASQGSVSGLEEFRPLTVLCVGIRDLVFRCQEDLARVQDVFCLMQRVVHDRDGHFVRFSMHDKGPMVMFAFGLPGSAHEDDPVRAMLAAQEILSALSAHPVDAHCVVATGLAFCGIVGNRNRRTHAITGVAVNRAAKLLARATTHGILCDAEVANASRHRFAYEPLIDGDTTAGETTDLFRLHEAISPRSGEPPRLIGRDSELASLNRYIAEHRHSLRASVMQIEGEAGIGKSALIATLPSILDSDVMLIRSSVDPLIDASAPYAAWRPIFATLFASEIEAGPVALTNAVAADLAGQQLGYRYITLVRVVLPELPASDAGGPPALPDDVAEATIVALTALLRQRLAGQTSVIVIEDVHWIDSASATLVSRVAQDLRGVLLVLVGRPVIPGRWPVLQALPVDVKVERLELRSLERGALAQVLADALQSTELAAEVTDAIQRRAAGNPLFAIQLALSLRDQGALVTDNGVDRFREHVIDLVEGRLPDSVQCTILARIDGMPLGLQLTLKAASVVGQVFSARALHAIIGDPAVRAAIEVNLPRLAELGVTRLLGPSGDPDYEFSHVITHDVVYGTMSFGQRRALHEAFAHFLETTGGGAMVSRLLLGLHWSRADQPMRALPYLEEAGLSALAGGAYRESAEALTQALRAVRKSGNSGVDRSREGRLSRALGEALLQTGEVALARHRFADALTCFGFAWPATKLGALGALCRHSIRLTWREILPANGKRVRPVQETSWQAARTLESLGQVCGHQSDILGMATATISALNLSRTIGDDAGYSRCAGLLSLVFLLVGRPQLAERYLTHSRRTTPDHNQPHDRLMSCEYIAMYLLAAARLDEAEQELRAMRALASQVSNHRRLMDASSLLFLTLMARGDASGCEAILPSLRLETRRHGDPQLRCWASLEAAELALLRDDLEGAEAALAEASGFLSQVARHERIWALGLLARLYHLQRRPVQAAAQAQRTMQVMGAGRTVSFYAQAGVFGAAEVYLAALEDPHIADPALRADAGRMIRRIARYALRLPITRPRGLVLLSRYAAVRGRWRGAAQLLERARRELTVQRRPIELFAPSSTIDAAPIRDRARHGSAPAIR